jgi:DNA invertase Pin-like site-specific DNA recombinase
VKDALIPVAILVRVSTSKQETDRQVSELSSYARDKGYNIVEVAEETASGRSCEEQREGLKKVLQLAQEGLIKKVLVHEVSRLARKNSVAHKFVETLDDFGVSLYWHAQGVETLLPNGKRNPSARIMLALLAEIARAEVETLRDRISSGLAEARRKGVKLGRPLGTKLDKMRFLKKHKDVSRLLSDGYSIRHVAKICDKGISTVQRVRSVITLTHDFEPGSKVDVGVRS